MPVLTLTFAACATGGESLAQLEQQLEGDASAGERQAAQAEGSSEGGEGSGEDGVGPVLIACP